MKKIISIFAFAFLLAVITPAIASAQSGDNAPDGFYKFTKGKEEFVSLDKVPFMTLGEKVALLNGDYYLIFDMEAYAPRAILNSSSDAELDKKKESVNALKNRLQIEIDSDGKVTPGATDDDFQVEDIS